MVTKEIGDKEPYHNTKISIFSLGGKEKKRFNCAGLCFTSGDILLDISSIM